MYPALYFSAQVARRLAKPTRVT